MDLTTIVVSVVVAVIATICDFQAGKIPNLLTFPAMAAGLVHAFACHGMGTGLERCFLLIILFLFGGLSLMGMGDLKLLMAFGTLNGALCLAITVFVAALLLLAVEVLRHRKETWLDIKAGLHSLLTLKFSSELGTGRKVKFAPYLLCGLIGGVIICSVL